MKDKTNAGYSDSFEKKAARADLWRSLRVTPGRIGVFASTFCGDVKCLTALGVHPSWIDAYDVDPAAVEAARALGCEGHLGLLTPDTLRIGRPSAFHLDFCSQISPAALELVGAVGRCMSAGADWVQGSYLCTHAGMSVLAARKLLSERCDRVYASALAVTFLKGREQHKEATSDLQVSANFGHGGFDDEAPRHKWRRYLAGALAGRISFSVLLRAMRDLYPEADAAELRAAILLESLRGMGQDWACDRIIEYFGSSPMVTFILTPDWGRRSYCTPYCFGRPGDPRFCESFTPSHFHDYPERVQYGRCAKAGIVGALVEGEDPGIYGLTRAQGAALKAVRTRCAA